MRGEYPRFRASYARDELVVQFLLTPQDHELIAHCRGDVNRYGVAILLKSLPYLGYFPNDLRKVPREVRGFIVHQLHLPWDVTVHRADKPWNPRKMGPFGWGL